MAKFWTGSYMVARILKCLSIKLRANTLQKWLVLGYHKRQVTSAANGRSTYLHATIRMGELGRPPGRYLCLIVLSH